MEEDRFDGKVYALVAKIPQGKVVTYGQLAFLLQVPRSARRVGRARILIRSAARVFRQSVFRTAPAGLATKAPLWHILLVFDAQGGMFP